ncbi:MAG: saccharopine dehydrogenase NADP-binding domain-containing protein [Bacteroidota bacterium]
MRKCANMQMMERNNFLLYGANGYTGKLITRMAADYGLSPILAGRNESAIRQMADEFDMPYRVLDLDNEAELKAVLSEVKLVLHAAGPFQHTAKPMIDACLKTGCHYLDITGEIAVFEMCKSYHQKAIEAGILLMPGVGFDVVPTDCMALFLKKQMPDATSLQLAFASVGGALSHGTATAMAEGLGQGGAVRINGKIVKKPLGHKGMWVDFGPKKLYAMTIPWGDVSTAYHTTSIPDIETYTSISPKIFYWLKYQWMFNWLLRTDFIRSRVKKRIDSKPAGPEDEARANATSLVWGEVTNAAGKEISARMQGPDGYTMTAHTSLIIVKKIMEGTVSPGYHTPAEMFGEDLVLQVPGVKRWM